MKGKEERKPIGFRRVRGRIVPIFAGLGAVSVGRAVGKEELFNSLQNEIMKNIGSARSKIPTPDTVSSGIVTVRDIFRTPKFDSYTNRITKRLSKTYANALNKAGVDSVISGHGAIKPWERRTSFLHMGTEGGKVTKHILLVDRSRFSFLHELGHAELQAKPSLLHKINMAGMNLRNFDESAIMHKSALNSNKGRLIASKAYQNTWKFLGKQARAVGSAMQLPEEIGAWVKGAEHLKTTKQKIAMTKASLAPLGTYALFPAQQALRLGLVTAGIGLVGYGLFNKGNKK